MSTTSPLHASAPFTVVITGGSSGIGLATALQFAAAGRRIVLAGRRADALADAAARVTAKGARVETVAVDLATADGVAKLRGAIENGGRIDVLVNNAGVAPLRAIAEMSDAEFDQLTALNMRAVFALTRGVWPMMRAQGGGVIVNLSSVAATDPFPGFAAYGASKAWVSLFTQAAGNEGRPHNIRVFGVAPGAVETPMLRQHFADFPAEQTLSPEAVARVIVALCGDEFASSSGQTVTVRK